MDEPNENGNFSLDELDTLKLDNSTSLYKLNLRKKNSASRRPASCVVNKDFNYEDVKYEDLDKHKSKEAGDEAQITFVPKRSLPAGRGMPMFGLSELSAAVANPKLSLGLKSTLKKTPKPVMDQKSDTSSGNPSKSSSDDSVKTSPFPVKLKTLNKTPVQGKTENSTEKSGDSSDSQSSSTFQTPKITTPVINEPKNSSAGPVISSVKLRSLSTNENFPALKSVGNKFPNEPKNSNANSLTETITLNRTPVNLEKNKSESQSEDDQPKPNPFAVKLKTINKSRIEDTSTTEKSEQNKSLEGLPATSPTPKISTPVNNEPKNFMGLPTSGLVKNRSASTNENFPVLKPLGNKVRDEQKSTNSSGIESVSLNKTPANLEKNKPVNQSDDDMPKLSPFPVKLRSLNKSTTPESSPNTNSLNQTPEKPEFLSKLKPISYNRERSATYNENNPESKNEPGNSTEKPKVEIQPKNTTKSESEVPQNNLMDKKLRGRKSSVIVDQESAETKKDDSVNHDTNQKFSTPGSTVVEKSGQPEPKISKISTKKASIDLSKSETATSSQSPASPTKSALQSNPLFKNNPFLQNSSSSVDRPGNNAAKKTPGIIKKPSVDPGEVVVGGVSQMKKRFQ